MSSLHRAIVTALAGACVVSVAAGLAAQSSKTLETYSALAVDMNATPPLSPTANVQIGIERWASDEEREALYTTLVEAGPNKLLDRIRKMPPAGYIRTPDSVGYDLRYARKTKIGDDEQIVLVTDRPIGFWEAKNQPRVADYPFTVIELRIKPNGEGEGKLSVATKITADPDGRGIVLENYGISPILLNAVKKGRS